MSLFFTSLTNNSNLQKSAFDYFKATNVDMSHFRRNCILQQLFKDHNSSVPIEAPARRGGNLLHIFARETNDPSRASIGKP